MYWTDRYCQMVCMECFLFCDAAGGKQDFIFESIKLPRIASDSASLQYCSVCYGPSGKDCPVNALSLRKF